MATYNGHKNWNYWNVALWIGNDEGMYRLALDCIRQNKGRGGLNAAARDFVQAMHDGGNDKTPDGARYTQSAVRAALAGLEG